MARAPKPKVLGDIAGPRADAPRDNFSRLPARVNLSRSRVLRLPLSQIAKVVVYLSAASFLIFGSVAAPTSVSRAVGQPNGDERKALEAQLARLEDQINQYEGQVAGYQKQGKNLKSEITALNAKIAKLNLQIQAINLTFKQLDNKISETGAQISATESDINSHRASLAQIFQNIYENENASLMEIFLKSPKLSDFFGDVNNTLLLQNNLRIAVRQISDLRDQLKDRQEQFALARADAATVQAYQVSQKTEIASAKEEKNNLLSVTKGQEAKYQTLLKQTKETAAQIRSRIFQLLGGGELSFDEAYKYAKLAGSATGIKPALLLAVLDRESALGQNVGRCGYKTAMSPASRALFLQLTAELGINPDTMTVSCPNRDGVYGGAMGPAQFVPATWNLYKDGVAKITGNSPASPWSNADAFVATALYLKDAMAGCASVYSSDASRDRCVAAKYYAGSRWRNYLWTYGEAVVSRARGFQDDIDTITG